MDKPYVSVIIINYNVKELLLQCLSSLFKKSNNSLHLEVIVIDNDSKDDSVASVLKEFPQVILIANKFNVGFSAANNQGLLIAKGEFIFLLNPDTEIIENTLEQLYFFLFMNNNCSIVVPKLLNSNRTVQVSVWKNHMPIDMVIETFFLHKLFSRLNYKKDQLDSSFEVKTASGAALFFRIHLIQKIGMLDEFLFWMEDVDFCTRAQIQGKIIYLNEALVIHHSGQSQKKNYNVSIANQLLSKLKYYKKYNSFPGFFFANFCCFIFIISRIIIFAFLSPFKNIYKLKLKAYCYTLIRYYKYLILGDKKLI